PDAASALGVDEHEGPERPRRPLPELPWRALHDQHHPGGDAASLLRPRPRRAADADGRWERRRDARSARGRGCRRRSCRSEAAVRGCDELRRGLGRPHVHHRQAERGASRLTTGGLMATATLTTQLRAHPSWATLEKHYDEIRDVHLRDLFASDPTRGERLVAEGAGLYLDYSKNRITDETIGLLLQLADESGLAERTEAMFR